MAKSTARFYDSQWHVFTPPCLIEVDSPLSLRSNVDKLATVVKSMKIENTGFSYLR